MATLYERAMGLILRRKRSYQQMCLAPASEVAMADLAKFCYANKSCWDPDPRIHAVLEGRREVWLRFQEHIQLSQERLARLYEIADNPE